MSETTASSRTSNLIAAGVLVIALAAVFLVGLQVNDDDPVATGGTTNETFGIVTGGEGKVTGIPDQLSFRASVSNTRATTSDALDATNHDIRAITISAKQAGVAPKDIQSVSLSLQPKYDYSSRPRKIVGYTARQQVKIMVRTLSKAGKTIGSVTTSAGNAVRVGNIALSISNQQELVAQARAKAVKKSKAAALALAKAAGRDVGKLEYVEEVVPQQYGYYNRAQAYGGILTDLAPSASPMALAASVPISPGTQSISVTVQVRWSLG